MAFGDRPDGYLLRDIDPMHIIMPLVWPDRADNEAFIFERLDCSAVDAYLEAKNAAAREAEGNPEDFFKYTMFHFVVAVMMKTMILRPKLNYFIANKRMYQHKELSGAFTIKKKFADNAEEGLAVFKAKPEDTIDTVRDFIRGQIERTRKIIKGLNGECVALYLIFCPLSYLRLQVGYPRMMELIRENPEAMKHALRVIAGDVKLLVRGIIEEAGADGIFFSVQNAEENRFTYEEYREWVTPSEKEVLDYANTLSTLNAIHLCAWEEVPEYTEQ